MKRHIFDSGSSCLFVAYYILKKCILSSYRLEMSYRISERRKTSFNHILYVFLYIFIGHCKLSRNKERNCVAMCVAMSLERTNLWSVLNSQNGAMVYGCSSEMTSRHGWVHHDKKSMKRICSH